MIISETELQFVNGGTNYVVEKFNDLLRLPF